MIAGVATATTWIALHENDAGQWTSSVGAFAVFAVTYGICVGLQWRRGLLRAPGEEPSTGAS